MQTLQKLYSVQRTIICFSVEDDMNKTVHV